MHKCGCMRVNLRAPMLAGERGNGNSAGSRCRSVRYLRLALAPVALVHIACHRLPDERGIFGCLLPFEPLARRNAVNFLKLRQLLLLEHDSLVQELAVAVYRLQPLRALIQCVAVKKVARLASPVLGSVRPGSVAHRPLSFRGVAPSAVAVAARHAALCRRIPVLVGWSTEVRYYDSW